MTEPTDDYTREDDAPPRTQSAAEPSPSPNVPLLRKAVEFVEASYERQVSRTLAWQNAMREHGTLEVPPNVGLHWNQRDWSSLWRDELPETEVSGDVSLEDCGTAYCVAGYVVSIQPEYSASVQPLAPEYQVPNSGNVEMELVETWNGETLRADDSTFSHSALAQELLGLTSVEAARLFSGYNSVETVRRLAEEIAGEKL